MRTQVDAGLVEIEWLDEVTWPRVHDKLLEHEWHVLHFIGHGSYDSQTDEGVLAFVGRDGRADMVTASSLADLLDEAEPTPRLVLLNSCRSGAGGGDDLFSGTAAALAHSGIQAVAAMQFAISDSAAIEFARGFYAALAHGRGIDEAVRSGRIGILGTGRGTLEWVTPVLYLRGEDTHLFEVRPTAAAPSTARRAGRARSSSPAATTQTTARTAPTGIRRRRAAWLAVGGVALVGIGATVIAMLLAQSQQGGGNPEAGSGSSPATKKIDVPMYEGWTDTEMTCEAGDTLQISARGEFRFESAEGEVVGPDGFVNGEQEEDRAFPDDPTAALMGILGRTATPFLVGLERSYQCQYDGELRVGPNDRSPGDNVGWLQVEVTRIPAE